MTAAVSPTLPAASPEMSGGALAHRPIYVARQPIYDRAGNIRGYELLFRDGSGNFANVTDDTGATSQVIIDGLALIEREIGRDVFFLINFPADLFFSEGLHILPKERCILEILETVVPTPEVLKNITNIKTAGFRIALDDYVGQKELAPFLELADLIKVEVLGIAPHAILAIVNRLKAYDVQLLAEKIEDASAYEFCRAAGFDFFQGYYFGRPQLIGGKTLSPSRQTRARLLAQVSDPNYNTAALGRLVASDPALSFRLLRFVNSAAFARAKPAETTEQAVVLLGQRGLRQWLAVALVSDLEDTPRSRELSHLCVKRARFLELLTRAPETDIQEPADRLFALGLFSKLDAFLDQPMSEVVELLQLTGDMRAALCGESVAIRDWLDLCESIEQGRFDRLQELLTQRQLLNALVAQAHLAAGVWAKALLGMNRDVSSIQPPS